MLRRVLGSILLVSTISQAATKADVTDAMKEATRQQREAHRQVQRILYGTEVGSAEDVPTDKEVAHGLRIQLIRR